MTRLQPPTREVPPKAKIKKDANRKDGSSSLQTFLIVVMCICVLVMGHVNLAHTSSAVMDYHAYSATMYQAIEDFRQGGRANINNPQKQVQDDPQQGESIIEKKAAAPPKLPGKSKIASLSCDIHGGPDLESAQEMVYWSDVPSDSLYVSPFRRKREGRKYMTFEPDGGGWNNIRMAMETVVGLAVATGRTLVLPPRKVMYLLGNGKNQQKRHFGFEDFFPMHQMAAENAAIDMITMEEFLQTEAMTGRLRNKETGQVSFPPYNRTDWNGLLGKEYDELREWLRTVTLVPQWHPDRCLAAFPSDGNHKSVQDLQEMQNTIHQQGGINPDIYKGNPVGVDAEPIDRLKENLNRRKELCVYDEKMQQEPVIHFACAHKLGLRLLVHFYAFLYMEDWKEDLWIKRFMRDHMRYNDDIQCAGARLVKAMRQKAREHDPSNTEGIFDTLHIRRGDFQYKDTRISAEQIYENTKDKLVEHSTIFIATDERDKSFFDPLKQHYNVFFLDDFMDLLEGINTNYFGMIDQLVASRGRTFFGCWFSTFTGFINRMRGYRSVKDKLPGHEDGVLPTSFYYSSHSRRDALQQYVPLSNSFFAREFPTSWRGIDKGIGELPGTALESQ